jgi:hypothetical protein
MTTFAESTKGLSFHQRKYIEQDDKFLLIEEPYRYKNKWLIWPDTLLVPMHISDCNDTIQGVCYDNQTLYECIDKCVGDCGAGVFIKFKKTGKSICIPIRTGTHPNLNPVFRLRRKEYYKIGDIEASTFINTTLFPFPPNLGNALFYQNVINITNSNSSNAIIASNTSNTKISLGKDDNINLLIAPHLFNVGLITENIPVKYGDKFNILIPGTTLIAAKSTFTNFLEWRLIPPSTTIIEDVYFAFLPIIDTKKIGDTVSLKEKCWLIYGTHGAVFMNKNNHLEISDRSFNNIKSSDQNYEFTVESVMLGFYCDKGKCLSIPSKNIIPGIKGHDGFYKNSENKLTPVYSHRGCWNKCSENNNLSDQTNFPPSNSSNNLILFSASIIIVIILSIILSLFINKKIT